MKKIIYQIIILFSISYLSFGQDAGELCSQSKIKAFSQLNKISQVQYPGDGNIDVTYYKLNLTLTANPNFISGVVTVKAKSTFNRLSNFFLDLKNNLTVSLVTINGSAVTFTQTSDHKINIALDRLYSVNEQFTAEITYSGFPQPGTGFISNASISFFDQSAGKTVIATLSEPYGARDWWPSKDTPADKVDSSDVWITADKFFVSVSNGQLIETVDNPDGTRTYKWKNHYPIANYLISVAMTNYQTINDQYEYEPGKFLPLIHYCYPERLNDSRRAAVAKTKDMLHIYSQRFGAYPYLKEKYGHAEFAWGGGMEHQTITSLGGNTMSLEMYIAHELGHQWYGDKVTCKNWQNIWLNEGFASYCECVYREGQYGTADYNNYVNSFMVSAKTATGTIYVQNINDESQIFNSARSYKKGAIVLHMLRGVVGDSVFFQIMRQYANEPGLAYNVATTEDFQRMAERVSGMNLNYFFQEWIYGENYPQYTFGWGYQQVNGENYILKLRSVQNVNNALNPVFFTMPIQIKYTTPNETKTVTVFNNVIDQGWEIQVNGQPQSVQFDPDNWILNDVIGTIPVDSETVPTDYYLAQNYPNPFNPTTNIKYVLPVNSLVTLKIYDELGNYIATIVNETKKAGTFETMFDGRKFNLASGVYFYALTAGDFKETKKMILLK